MKIPPNFKENARDYYDALWSSDYETFEKFFEKWKGREEDLLNLINVWNDLCIEIVKWRLGDV